MSIQRTNGQCLTLHRGKYYITYYEDDKRKQKFTGTADRKEAEIFRDKFLKDATYRERPDRYIYKQGRKWLVQVRGVKVGRFEDIELAREAKTKFMKGLKNE